MESMVRNMAGIHHWLLLLLRLVHECWCKSMVVAWDWMSAHMAHLVRERRWSSLWLVKTLFWRSKRLHLLYWWRCSTILHWVRCCLRVKRGCKWPMGAWERQARYWPITWLSNIVCVGSGSTAWLIRHHHLPVIDLVACWLRSWGLRWVHWRRASWFGSLHGLEKLVGNKNYNIKF